MKKILILITLVGCTYYSNAQFAYNLTTVYTPKGTPVEGKILIPPDYSSSQKLAIKNQTLADHPNATFLAEATGTYNCHSYAFHLSEGQTPIVWINQYDVNGNPNVYKYWTDGSFIQVCNESDADKVHYYTGDHSAVISTTVIGKYESKWGPNIRIRHDPTDVPSIYNGSYRHYYASTKILGDASNLCSGTRTFSVKNISGATYTWTCSSTLSAVGASNTNQYVVQRNGTASGDGWIKVQISTTCSSITATRQLDFSVAAYPVLTGTISQNGQSQTLYTVNSVSSGAVSVHFQWPDVSSITCVQGSTNPPPSSTGFIYYPSNKSFWFTIANGESVSVNLSGTSSCNGTVTATRSFYISHYSYLVTPNPVSGTLTITQEGKIFKTDGKTVQINDNVSYLVNIYDVNTNMLKLSKRSQPGNKKMQLDVSSLKTGYYVVEIVTGNDKKSYKIFKQ